MKKHHLSVFTVPAIHFALSLAALPPDARAGGAGPNKVAGPASTCETFPMQLYENRDGRSIGEHTQGTTGAPLMIDLPHDAMVIVCTRRFFFPYSGKPFTTHGIAPDTEITPTVEKFLANDDRAKKTAVELLKR